MADFDVAPCRRGYNQLGRPHEGLALGEKGMTVKIRKAMILLLAAVVALGLLSGCDGETDSASTSVEASGQASGALSAEGDALVPDGEYERAIWYGFADDRNDADAATTEAAFVEMLSAMIQKFDSDSLAAFEGVSFVQDADQSQIPRFYAAILLLYAAEAMDCAALPNGTYPTMNAEAVDWEAFWATDWGMTDGLSESAFAESSATMTEAWGEPMSHYHGGINFAVSRLSLASGKPLLDVDDESYMRQNEYLTHREAAVAVVRLFESNSETMELFPEDPTAAAVAEDILAKAEERRQAILNSPTEVSYAGAAYYVSNSGKDSNSGESPESPWATIGRVNQASLKAGDAVFFERGGTWRAETLDTQEGVTYSAYGEGAMPRLIASPENGADAEKWALLEGTDNIWVYHEDMLDCGVVVLDGSVAARKVIGFWDGSQYLEYAGQGASEEELLSAPAFDVKKQLDEDLTFFSHASDGLPAELPAFLDGAMSQHDGTPLTCRTKGKLYLRCDEGNPGEVYESIEFATPLSVFDDPVAEGCTLDNLFIGFSGSGVSVGNAGLTIQNCELAWIGGCIISYSFEDHDGNPRGTLRVGGAVGSHADELTICGNYIHEIYEEAALVEIFESQEAYTEDLVIEDVTMSGNLVYHVGSGIGYYNWDMERNPEHMFKSFAFEDNMVLFTGLNDWLSKHISCAFVVDGGPNLQEEVVVRDNVFFASRDCLIFINQYHADTVADYEGNQYVQYVSYPFLLLNEEQRRHYGDEAEYAVRELLDDQTGSVTTLRSAKWDKSLDW